MRAARPFIFIIRKSAIFYHLKNGSLGQLYFGRHIRDREDFSHLLELQYRPLSPGVFEEDKFFSLDQIKQEYPSYGSSDYRRPAFEIKQPNGSNISAFAYRSHRIFEGKEPLAGLPATYVEQKGEAQTLEITLVDELLHAEIILSYTVFEDYAAVARSARFTNKGTEEYDLTAAMSMCLDLPDSNYEWIQLSGAWSRERSIKKGYCSRASRQSTARGGIPATTITRLSRWRVRIQTNLQERRLASASYTAGIFLHRRRSIRTM